MAFEKVPFTIGKIERLNQTISIATLNANR
jgi:hypothetical protein